MMLQELTLPHSSSLTNQVIFAGDNVRLAGQIDYPNTPMPENGYPLLFILPHACCTGRHGFDHHTAIGNNAGYAVFRWDKRGTGHSASGGTGSPTQDALNAYHTAIHQTDVDANNIVIWSQTDASRQLGESYLAFKAIQQTRGIILAGNMLDEQEILELDTRLFCVTGERDWNLASRYALAVAQIHEKQHQLGSQSYIAQFANRRLIDTRNDMFHSGAEVAIHNWLKALCQISKSN